MRQLLLLLALPFVFLYGPVFAQDHTSPPEQYGIKESSPPLGSHVRRDIIRVANVPINRSYEDLSAEQKKVLKSNYEAMPEADEPPFPSEGLLPIVKALAAKVDSLKIKPKGPITLYADIDSDGKVKTVAMSESPDPELTKIAAYTIMLQKFKPAKCHGTPCAMTFPFSAEFLSYEDKSSRDSLFDANVIDSNVSRSK